jgi:hypothetical protein
LYKLCRQLREACLKFQKTFIDENGIDPLWEATTIAGACMAVFQQIFVKENTIAIIPGGGYRLTDRSSFVGRMWIEWVAKERNIRIQSAHNGPEKKIRNFKVDGYYKHPNGNEEVLEFLGCLFHGCPRCHVDKRAKINGSDETVGDRYEATERRLAILRATCVTVTTIWEWNFEQMRKDNPDINNLIKKKP